MKDETFNTRIHIVDKKTGEIYKQSYFTDPLFLFHHINAYEKRDSANNLTEIICDICAYDAKYFDINSFSYVDFLSKKNIGTKAFHSVGRRINIPFGEIKNEPIYCQIRDLNSDLAFEFPTINYSRFNGKFYRYFYGTNLHEKPFSIIKINAENPNEIWRKSYDKDGKEYLPSEPVFVENPNPQSEDDGVLLVMVLTNKNDYLSILDAKNLNEIATAVVPENVLGAYSFHGFFADRKTYKALND